MKLHMLKAGQLAKLWNGLHGDGGGLYLKVEGEARSWIFRYKPRGAKMKQSRKMGLGALDAENAGASLALARELAADARRLLSAGIDPRAHRNAERAKEAAKHRHVPTFKAYATAYTKAHLGTFKNAKHRQQWVNTLGLDLEEGGEREMDYCVALHPMRLDAIDTAAVRKVLDPIWHSRPETASRLRGRIERILDAAKVEGHRAGENAAAWKGHLDAIYPAKRKVRKIRHQPALPYRDLPAFMARIAALEGVAEQCLAFLILTAARSQEARGALWTELDLDAARWTIPAERMKRERPHAVPLSKPALAILGKMRRTRISPYVFPGQRRGQCISDSALRMVLRAMGIKACDATVHGMRSSFRDWAAECTHAPNIVCEKALAHGVSDGTEAAYRRGDLFQKRIALMQEWGAFCVPATARPSLIRRRRLKLTKS